MRSLGPHKPMIKATIYSFYFPSTQLSSMTSVVSFRILLTSSLLPEESFQTPDNGLVTSPSQGVLTESGADCHPFVGSTLCSLPYHQLPQGKGLVLLPSVYNTQPIIWHIVDG